MPKIPVQPLLNIKYRHLEIMRRLLAGQTNKQICEEMEMSGPRLSIIIASPLFRAELERRRKELDQKYIEKATDISLNIQGRIKELQPKAVEALEELLVKKEVNGQKVNPRLKRDVANDILEIAGSGRKRSVHEDGMNDLAKLIAAAYNKAKDDREKQITDVEAQDVTAEDGKLVVVGAG